MKQRQTMRKGYPLTLMLSSFPRTKYKANVAVLLLTDKTGFMGLCPSIDVGRTEELTLRVAINIADQESTGSNAINLPAHHRTEVFS
ncbi:hypothetical protein AKJ16_DCAP26759 [Drosera capensis]